MPSINALQLFYPGQNGITEIEELLLFPPTQTTSATQWSNLLNDINLFIFIDYLQTRRRCHFKNWLVLSTHIFWHFCMNKHNDTSWKESTYPVKTLFPTNNKHITNQSKKQFRENSLPWQQHQCLRIRWFHWTISRFFHYFQDLQVRYICFSTILAFLHHLAG